MAHHYNWSWGFETLLHGFSIIDNLSFLIFNFILIGIHEFILLRILLLLNFLKLSKFLIGWLDIFLI